MIISYATRHIWSKPCLENPLDHYGKSDQKKIKKTLGRAKSLGITHAFKPADQDFFNWFQPLYEQSIAGKENPKIVNVRELTIDQLGSKLEYFTLTIYENETPIGGCIFSNRKDRFSIAYRMFNNKWSTDERIAGPALYAEYLLDLYSNEHNKARLTHGQDRNPYGLNSAIGLAIFKLSIGCYPEVPVKHTIDTIDTDQINQDVLVLLPPQNGNRITEANFYVKEDHIKKYEQLFNYSDRLTINTFYR